MSFTELRFGKVFKMGELVEVEILTHTHTHEGEDLQKGAVIRVTNDLARWLVNMKIGAIISEVGSISGD